MPEEKVHECKEQVGRKMSWDMLCSGEVKIHSDTEGTWYCEGGDASMSLTFCPYCGARLDGKPSKAALMDDVAKSAKDILDRADTDAHIEIEELVVSIVDRYEKLEA